MDEEIKFTFSSQQTTDTKTINVEMTKWVGINAPWTEAAGLFMQFMKLQYGVDVDVILSARVGKGPPSQTVTTGDWGLKSSVDIKMST